VQIHPPEKPCSLLKPAPLRNSPRLLRVRIRSGLAPGHRSTPAWRRSLPGRDSPQAIGARLSGEDPDSIGTAFLALTHEGPICVEIRPCAPGAQAILASAESSPSRGRRWVLFGTAAILAAFLSKDRRLEASGTKCGDRSPRPLKPPPPKPKRSSLKTLLPRGHTALWRVAPEPHPVHRSPAGRHPQEM